MISRPPTASPPHNPGKRRYRWLLHIGILIALIAGLIIGGRAMQHSLVYFPSRVPLPSASGALPGAEEVRLPTSDGLELTSWFVPPNPNSSPRGQAVLFAHGNAGTLADRIGLAYALTTRGFAVLMVGYRGFAENPGTPDEAGLIQDALAGQQELEARGFAPADTIYLGESIGTGVIVGLAMVEPPGGLVLRSPFTSLWDVGATLVPAPPLVRTLLSRNEYPLARQIATLGTPVVVLHGTSDEIVPSAQSAAVAATAPNLFREIAIEGARHNDERWQGRLVADAVVELGDALQASAPGVR